MFLVHPKLVIGAIATTNMRNLHSWCCVVATMTSRRTSVEDERPTARSARAEKLVGTRGQSSYPGNHALAEGLKKAAQGDAGKHHRFEMRLLGTQMPRDRHGVGAGVGGLGQQQAR